MTNEQWNTGLKTAAAEKSTPNKQHKKEAER